MWGVWHGGEDFSALEKYWKILSEFGMQSFPEPKTAKTFAQEKTFTLLLKFSFLIRELPWVMVMLQNILIYIIPSQKISNPI